MRTRFIRLAWVAALAFIITACSSTPGTTVPDASRPGDESEPRTVTAAPLPTETDWEFWGEEQPSSISMPECVNYAFKETRGAPYYDGLLIAYIEASIELGSHLVSIEITDSTGGEHVIRSSVASLKFEHPEATFTLETNYAAGWSREEGGAQETARVRLTPYQRGVLLGNPQDTIITIIGSHGTRSAMFESDAWAWLSHAAVCLEGASSD